MSKLQDIARDGVMKIEEDIAETSPSLDLLLQFQRLLIARIFPRYSQSCKVEIGKPGINNVK